MKIAIIVAMDKELRQLEAIFGGCADVVVRKCGIGKVNAALGAAEVIARERPDAVVSSGCAGGHGADISVQDVVVSTELAYHDVYCGGAAGQTVYGQVQGLPARFKADDRLLSAALEVGRTPGGPTVRPGLIVSGDWFVDAREKMLDIVAKFPEARAVDMESAAIAQTCYLWGVPFISFRVVSDVPLSDHHAAQYHDFWERIADRSFGVTRAFVDALRAK